MPISEAGTARIVAINHRLEHLFAQRDVIDAEARSLQAEGHNIENSGASISRIPNEVLSAIFEAGYIQQDDHGDDCFEILVSAVTSHWRQVALRTPKLWTRIRREPYQDDLACVIAYLERSKAVSFNLLIDIGVPHLERRDQPAREFDDLSAFCKLIASQLSRCNRMSISLVAEPAGQPDIFDYPGNQSMDLMMQHFIPLAAPLLRSIEITRGDMVPLRSKRTIRFFTRGTPLLESLRLRGVGLRFYTPPLESIQSIQIETFHWTTCQEFCDALAAATSLVHLNIMGEVVNDWKSSLSSTKLKLPSLRTLFIGSCREPEGHFVGLLNTITAPLLESLVLEGFTTTKHLLGGTLPISKFQGLKWLVLENVDAPLSTFAEPFGSVQHLVFDGASELLVETPVSWPRLRTIAFPRWSGCFYPNEPVWDKRAAFKLNHPLERIFVPFGLPPGAKFQCSLSSEKYSRDLAYGHLPSESIPVIRENSWREPE